MIPVSGPSVMPAFRVTLDTKAPPGFVARWWLDYGAADSALEPSMVKREATEAPDGSWKLVTELRHGRRIVRTDGTVRRVDPLAWSFEGELLVDGRPFGWEQVDYRVAPRAGGSRLTAEFRFRGRDTWHALLLALARGGARRGREQAFADFRRALEAEFAAAPSGGRPPPEEPSSRAPSTR